jgi:hypothetical protein
MKKDDIKLGQVLGKAYKPQDLGRLLNLDPRTVIKYAHIWGGVEVLPGTVRFFENLVKEKLNADKGNKTWQKEVLSRSDGERPAISEAVSRHKQGVDEISRSVGKKRARSAKKLTDPHGIFDPQ